MKRLIGMFALLLPRVALAASTPYAVPNPIGAEDLGQILQQVTSAILTLAIPVAAAMYIWAGILWMTAGAKPNNLSRAKEVFKYTTIGLVVILIGGGFVDLIRSIVNLGQ